MKFLVLPVALCALSAPVIAEEIDIHVDNFFVDGGITTVVLKITNTGRETIDNVFVSCAFLDEDRRALDIGKAWATDLAPGQVVYEKASAVVSDGVQYAACQRD